MFSFHFISFRFVLLGFGKEERDDADEVLSVLILRECKLHWLDWRAAFFLFYILGLVCVAAAFAIITTYALLYFWDWITSMSVVIEMRHAPLLAWPCRSNV